MKCFAALQAILSGDENEFTAELRAHLDSCSACRRTHERNRVVVQLISLKRHEQPDPHFATRCRAGVRQRIAALNEARASGWGRLWDLLAGETWTPVRLGAATVLVAAVSYYALTLSQQPTAPVLRDELPAVAAEPAALPAATIVVASNTVPDPTVLHAAAPPAQPVSNVGPAAVQYGPAPSVPVSFQKP